jgi:hypothetical protein
MPRPLRDRIGLTGRGFGLERRLQRIRYVDLVEAARIRAAYARDDSDDSGARSHLYEFILAGNARPRAEANDKS